LVQLPGFGSGRLRAIVHKICNEREVSLIAEELDTDKANKRLTVGRQVSIEKSIPWLNINIGDRITQRLGILHDLRRRRATFDDIKMEIVREIDNWIYFPRADCIREQRWLRKIVRHKRNSSALVLCGLIHVQSFASKMRELGFDVATESLCEHSWYRAWPHSKCDEVEKGIIDERY